MDIALMHFLLDTNIVSETLRVIPEPKVMAWLRQNSINACLSVVTLGEMTKGAELLDDGKKKTDTHAWISRIELEYKKRILIVDECIMKKWGVLFAHHHKAGRTLSILDSQIAATALCHGLTVVTRNTADFPEEVRVFNPWL